MGLNLEIWAVLVSAAGIIATCVVESVWFRKQMEQQTKHFDTQIQQQSHQLQAQFDFEIDASREQRILQNQRDTLDQVRRIANELTVLDNSATSPSHLDDCLHRLNFELFALVAMTNTLINDSQPTHSANLMEKIKELVKSVETLSMILGGHPQASPSMSDTTIGEIGELLQHFAALVLRSQPKKRTVIQAETTS